jgi:[CysO sulfur-carrier protein]-S-L-cysteine hydrolase
MGAVLGNLVLSLSAWQTMIQSVSNCLPEEGCGLLAGVGDYIHEVIPVENIEHSPVRYRMAPQDQLKAFLHMEEKSLELLGIYHSHPQGPETPSETDIAEAYYPEAIYVIISKMTSEWRMRGFSLQNKLLQEVVITVI